MTICQFSIVRPVATIVFMLLLVVFGFICLNRMAVREYPDIDVPTISIDTTYDGASSNVVETKITQRIEDAVAGIEGLDTISSISRDGRSRITLEFKVERDIDAAANDVRDKVSRILKKLPDDADTPVVAKYDSSGSPVLILALTSNKMSRMELTDYADRYLVDRFSVIDGVASVSIFGAQEEAMRIWLNRQAMAARGVTAEDVINVLNSENVENPGGRIESSEREFTVRLKRQYATEKDFRDLVIKRDKAGDYVRLRDVAEVKIDSRRPRQNFMTNKEPMVGQDRQTIHRIRCRHDRSSLFFKFHRTDPDADDVFEDAETAVGVRKRLDDPLRGCVHGVSRTDLRPLAPLCRPLQNCHGGGLFRHMHSDDRGLDASAFGI